VQFFQKPGHVLTEGLHRLDTFVVLAHLARIQTEADVPVTLARDDYLRQGKKSINSIIDIHSASPSYGNNRGAHLTFEHKVVGYGYKAGPVYQRLHLAADVAEVAWRAKNNSICPKHFLKTFVKHVLFLYALFVFFLKAFKSRLAAPDFLSGQLKKFGLYPLLLQFIQDKIDKSGGIAILSCAAVKSYDFHSAPSLSECNWSLF
jgi:hypothetical protein